MILLQRSRSLRRRRRLKFKMMLLEDSASLNHKIKGKMYKRKMLSRISVQIRITTQASRILVTFQEDLMISASKEDRRRRRKRRKRGNSRRSSICLEEAMSPHRYKIKNHNHNNFKQ